MWNLSISEKRLFCACHGYINPHCHGYFTLFSACHSDINPHTLQLLDEVEFQLVTKSGKTSASDVRLLPTGTISHEQIVGTDYHDGLVLRPMKSLDKKVTLPNMVVVSCCYAGLL